MTDLSALESELTAKIAAADAAALEALRIAALGKTGEISNLLKSLGAMSPDERREQGPKINGLRDIVATAIAARKAELDAAETDKKIAAERVDLTLPAPPRRKGSVHPIMQVMDEMIAIFAEMGFAVAEGPDIEDDFHNFAALNFTPHHPARDMQDTFYLEGGMLLRTHTSNGQIRVMEKRRPPLAVVCPGRCYRRDDLTVRSSPMFTQIEGFMVDKRGRITMAHLKGVLTEFARAFFGTTAVRFRASYFPFTEPSAELDMHCILCDGAGCPVCKHSGWTEVLGCGMIHPNVMRAVQYDPDEYQGFAFGMGVERTGLLKLGVDDMRLFFENDLRFLSQFPALSGGVR